MDQNDGRESMPCDAEPVLYKERKGAAGKIVTRTGGFELRVGCGAGKATVGYISHFVTCPRRRISEKGGAERWQGRLTLIS